MFRIFAILITVVFLSACKEEVDPKIENVLRAKWLLMKVYDYQKAYGTPPSNIYELDKLTHGEAEKAGQRYKTYIIKKGENEIDFICLGNEISLSDSKFRKIVVSAPVLINDKRLVGWSDCHVEYIDEKTFRRLVISR